MAQRLSGYTHETSPGSGPVLPPLQGDAAGERRSWRGDARLGERGCGADLRAILDDGADGDLWEAFARHGEALDADDGAGLDAASVDLERLGHRRRPAMPTPGTAPPRWPPGSAAGPWPSAARARRRQRWP